jgi:uncharacterized membrane protein
MPGYTFVAAMLPRKASLGPVQRLALSLGLSIAIVALMGFVLSYTPWGITLSTVTVSIAPFIMISCAFALYRRRQVPEQDRFAIRLDIGLLRWKEGSRLDRVLTIVLVLSALTATGTFAYSFTTPKEGEKYTEFYALGEQGLIEANNLKASEGEEVQVTLGIMNHEHQDTSYHIEVRLNEEKVQEVGPINLAHAGRWKGTVSFAAARVGNAQKVEFQMYIDGGSGPYRELHLWLDVEEAE